MSQQTDITCEKPWQKLKTKPEIVNFKFNFKVTGYNPDMKFVHTISPNDVKFS